MNRQDEPTIPLNKADRATAIGMLVLFAKDMPAHDILEIAYAVRDLADGTIGEVILRSQAYRDAEAEEGGSE